MQTPSRSLRLTGASNFRDLGGYVGRGGRSVRWRHLFRSDHLAALTQDDMLELSRQGLQRVCDFRGEAERAPLLCAMPGLSVNFLPIEPSVVQSMNDIVAAGRTLTAQDTVHLMEQTYHDFVHHNAHAYAEFFRLLLESDAPLVFHCTAGKDRTGFAAALILLALGVPRDVVMQDYLLTNEFFRMPVNPTGVLSQEVLQVLWRVQEAFLEAALHAVDADYGGLQSYMESALRVGPAERERLEELYLQAGAA
ncbi:MAG: tyrosine-protein phosphatase [Burkholderiaceae bacterium]